MQLTLFKNYQNTFTWWSYLHHHWAAISVMHNQLGKWWILKTAWQYSNMNCLTNAVSYVKIAFNLKHFFRTLSVSVWTGGSYFLCKYFTNWRFYVLFLSHDLLVWSYCILWLLLFIEPVPMSTLAVLTSWEWTHRTGWHNCPRSEKCQSSVPLVHSESLINLWGVAHHSSCLGTHLPYILRLKMLRHIRYII